MILTADNYTLSYLRNLNWTSLCGLIIKVNLKVGGKQPRILLVIGDCAALAKNF